MAKVNKAEFATSHEHFPEQMNFKKVSEDNITFWPFEKHDTLYCKFKSIEQLDHDVYLVEDLTSKRDYYLKSHDMIKTHIEGNEEKDIPAAKKGDIFKIVFIEKIDNPTKKKSFYVYDIFRAE